MYGDEDIISLCGELLYKITVIKGNLLQVKSGRNNVDYRLLILQEINEFESIVKDIIDIAKGSKCS